MELIVKEILSNLDVNEKEIKNYNMLSLAFLGDAIHSLFVREKLIEKANFKVNNLHKQATNFVKAKSQAYCLKILEIQLTEREKQVVKTARNTKTNNIAKNSTIKEYKNATAFESLLGYLALEKNIERLNQLLQKSYNIVCENLL